MELSNEAGSLNFIASVELISINIGWNYSNVGFKLLPLPPKIFQFKLTILREMNLFDEFIRLYIKTESHATEKANIFEVVSINDVW